jgi:cytochrome c
MLFKTFRTSAALVLGAALASAAWCGGATRAEAQAQVGAAVEHVRKVGADQAINDFNTAPQWKLNSMNVVFNDMQGLVLASSLNPRLVGKQTYEMKDPSGKQFVKEFTETARKGEGWVDYQFVNPQTKALEERSMFVRKVPGFEGYVGVAITK